MTKETLTSNTFSTENAAENVSVQFRDVVDDKLYLFISFINLGIICQAVSIIGTASNVINIIIFIKQGFSDTMNISLLALAISDLCSLLTMTWSNLCASPAFRDSDIQWVTHEVSLVTGIWPHLMFTRITASITAFISLERCVCVILPLKVKIMFTPRRHVIAMGTFFVVTLGCGSSIGFATAGVGWKFVPQRNRTLIGIVYHNDGYTSYLLDIVSFVVNGTLLPITSMICVSIFTSILVFKLKQTVAWRHSNSISQSQKKHFSNIDRNVNVKEQKAAKMVVLISIIFIACYMPSNIVFFIGCVEPKVKYSGQYKNLALILITLTFTAEAINSSINIFVYISMSSKYRKTFKSMFLFNRKNL